MLMSVPKDASILDVPKVEAAEYVPDFSSTTTTADYIRHAALEYGADPASLLATLTCESGLDPNAISQTQDYGVAQIHIASWGITKEQAFDPKFSIDFAAKEFAEGGAHYWVCYDMLHAQSVQHEAMPTMW